MPPTHRSPGCYQHCLVWYEHPEEGLVIGCTHCSHVSKRLQLSQTYTSEQVLAAVESSRSGHARNCTRPQRASNPSRPRPQPSRSYRRAQ